ncbi:MAG: hypothetical protein ACJA07_001518 [Rhodococcus sp. (in: high G+C Gram-positive bacteria)]|jgi:hypothetical protein
MDRLLDSIVDLRLNRTFNLSCHTIGGREISPQAVMIPVLDVHEGCRIHAVSQVVDHSVRQAATVISVTRTSVAVVALWVRVMVDSESVHLSILCGLDDLVAIDVDDVDYLPEAHTVGPDELALRRHPRKHRTSTAASLAGEGSAATMRQYFWRANVRTKRVVTEFDTRSDPADIVRFALRWHPYQGADASEVLLCFGTSMPMFGERLHQSLTDCAHGVVLDPVVHSELLEYADRLRMAATVRGCIPTSDNVR